MELPLETELCVGCMAFLLPLRHPTLVAKQVATLDLLCGGRLVFGAGVGGEFPLEYAACGVPLEERGAHSPRRSLLRQRTSALYLHRRLLRGGSGCGERSFEPALRDGFPRTRSQIRRARAPGGRGGDRRFVSPGRCATPDRRSGMPRRGT